MPRQIIERRNVVGEFNPDIFYDASCGDSSSACCPNAAGQRYVPMNADVSFGPASWILSYFYQMHQ